MTASNIQNDTIAALATPKGRGGIAVVRVSGSLAKDIALKITKTELSPRKATHVSFYDETNSVLDEGIAIFFPQPNSFTGEDVLEIQGHGGPVIVDMLLERLLSFGVRIARPGEFTERAFLNDKMDLAQAEAVADLIDATSKEAAKLAVKSLQGEFSNAVNDINTQIIHLRMYVEAAIDFSDQEINFLADEKIVNQIKNISATLIDLKNKVKQGSLLREGITAVIAGKPNVGKSSLLNCLSGKEMAIVTDIPGTTRDTLRDYILIDDLPMHLIDTAGLRNSHDVVEQEGIRRAYHEIKHADIILYVLDATNASENMQIVREKLLKDNNKQALIFIRNKIDLTNEMPTLNQFDDYTVVTLSVKNRLGIDLLKAQIKNQVGFQNTTEGIFLARRRHVDALEKALRHVEICTQQFNQNSGELMAEELRFAHLALSEITGQFTADDLLGKIFASFCIGK